MKKVESIDWTTVALHGAPHIEKLVSEYMLRDRRIPRGKTKIRVWQNQAGRFIAFVDITLLDHNGSSMGTAGTGSTELEALQDAIAYFMSDLAAAAERRGKDEFLYETDFDDSDPHDF
jgi:hypothetical protein